MTVDAFSIAWTKQYVYIFAPFSTLCMILWKIVEDEAEALVVAPLWTTQSCWPQLAHLIVDFPIKLPPARKILYQPNNPEITHPLQKLRLGAEKSCKAEEFKSECYLRKWLKCSGSLEIDPLQPSYKCSY